MKIGMVKYDKLLGLFATFTVLEAMESREWGQPGHSGI